MSEERIPVIREEPRPRGMPGLTWAVILIAVGAIILINNLNLPGLRINWLELLRYWPVILILVGLDILIGRRSVFGSLAVAAIALAVIGGLVWSVGIIGQQTILGPVATRDITQPLGDAQSLEVTMTLGAGETTLKALSGSPNVVEGKYTTNSALQVAANYTRQGSTGVLRITQTGSNDPAVFGDFIGKLDLGLTNAVPVDLTVDVGAGSTTLDLTSIQLRSLKIKTGVGSLLAILPNQGQFSVSAEAGIGSVTLRVPKSLDGRISYDGGISSLNVSARFAKTDDTHWQTPGFNSADNKVTFDLHTGIGSVDVVDQ